MRLTTKGRLAVAAMIDLALRQHRGPVTLAGIGQRQEISLSYLEQLFAKLRRHQLVESTRGPGGGYRLARPAESVSVADIILAVDEPMGTPRPVEAQRHGDDTKEAAKDLWAQLDRQMIDFLDSTSLRDLVEQHRSRSSSPSADVVPPRSKVPESR